MHLLAEMQTKIKPLITQSIPYETVWKLERVAWKKENKSALLLYRWTANSNFKISINCEYHKFKVNLSLNFEIYGKAFDI